MRWNYFVNNIKLLPYFKDNFYFIDNDLYFRSKTGDVLVFCKRDFDCAKTKFTFSKDKIDFMHSKDILETAIEENIFNFRPSIFRSNVNLNGTVGLPTKEFIIFYLSSEKFRERVYYVDSYTKLLGFDRLLWEAFHYFRLPTTIKYDRKANPKYLRFSNIKNDMQADAFRLMFTKSAPLNIKYLNPLSKRVVHSNYRRSRKKGNNIDVSKISSIDSLVLNKYNDALSSEEPMMCYLYYYQILEYLSQKWKSEVILKDIQNVLDSVDEDASKFSKVAKIVRTNDDGIVLSEFLSKYLKVGDFTNEFSSNDSVFYGSNNPAFISLVNIRLNYSDDATFAETLSCRIYKIRNTLVHASIKGVKHKEYDEPYNWETDYEDLIKELPLIKFAVDYIIFYNFKKD